MNAQTRDFLFEYKVQSLLGKKEKKIPNFPHPKNSN